MTTLFEKAEIAALRTALFLPFSTRSKSRFRRSLKKRVQPEIGWPASDAGLSDFRMAENRHATGHVLPFADTPSHWPLISVIVVSYNSVRDLPDALISLKSQTYPFVEVIVVENGNEATSDIVRSVLPGARYVHSPENLGFAGANNLGVKHANGEYICLVNPDAKLDPDCIAELFRAFDLDPKLAVTTPKLRFLTRFATIRLESDKPFHVVESEVLSQLAYEKLFIRSGQRSQDGRIVPARKELSRYHLAIDLPVDGSTVSIKCHAKDHVALTRDRRPAAHVIPRAGICTVDIALDDANAGDARWIINNAGTLVPDHKPFDRGFGDVDLGDYDRPGYVDAFCGCVGMVKRHAIHDRELFRDEFFAYFEDSELSHWLTDRGWKVLYWPRALAYHKHSTTSSEGSPLWNTLVSRSRAIYEFHTGQASLERTEKALRQPARYASVPSALAGRLEALDQDFLRRRGRFERQGLRIGLYNTYWNSMGGGEVHALQVASRLAKPEDEVLLISEEDFDLNEVCLFAGVEPGRFRKIVGRICSEDTSCFDIFINSTFGSNLRSKAPQSVYLVSFPHRNADTEALEGYRLFFNSPFTQSWADRVWGTSKGDIVLPTLSQTLSNDPDVEAGTKRKTILSVGRFSPDGHCKNQKEILQTFIACGDCAGWTLKIVGSLNKSRARDVAYFESLADISVPSDRSVEIIANASASQLSTCLSTASVYVHAAGLNRPESRPDLHEHFGISVFEACVHGCYPIVYGIGGPQEIVAEIGAGRTFLTEDELARAMTETAATFDPTQADDISHAALAYKKRNDTALRDILDEIHAKAHRLAIR